MTRIALTFFATCTVFLAAATYLQANGRMVINPEYVTPEQQDALTAYLTAQQVQGER